MLYYFQKYPKIHKTFKRNHSKEQILFNSEPNFYYIAAQTSNWTPQNERKAQNICDLRNDTA